MNFSKNTERPVVEKVQAHLKFGDAVFKRKFREVSDKFYNSGESVYETFRDESFVDLSHNFLGKVSFCLTNLIEDLNSLFKTFNFAYKLDYTYIFNIVYSMSSIFMSKSKFVLTMGIFNLCQVIFGLDLNIYVPLITSWINELVNKFVGNGVVSQSVDSNEPQVYDKFNNTASLFKMFIDSDICKSIRKLVLNLVALRFFNIEYSNGFRKLLGKPEGTNLLDFTYDLIDTVQKFIEFCKKCTSEGIYEGLRGGDVMNKFIDDTYEATLDYKRVYVGDDMNFRDDDRLEGRLPAKKFLFDLKKVLNEGERIQSLCKPSLTFKKRMFELKTIFSELKSVSQSRDRMAPLGIILHGAPGIGKSKILVRIYQAFCKHKGYVYDQNLIYNRNRSKYWDGYDPVTQPIIHLAEVGSQAENLTKNKGDERIEELLMVIDSAPYYPDKAVAEEKGKDYVSPELVVIDCNDPEMNLRHVVNNKAAVKRRFLYIDLEVRDNFRTPEGYLNTDLVEEIASKDENFNPLDIYKFELYYLRPNDNVNSTKEVVLKTNSIKEFDDCLVDQIMIHQRKQKFSKSLTEFVSPIESQASFFRSYGIRDFFWKTVLYDEMTYLEKIDYKIRLHLVYYTFIYRMMLTCISAFYLFYNGAGYIAYFLFCAFTNDKFQKVSRYRLRYSTGYFFSSLSEDLIAFVAGMVLGRVLVSLLITKEAISDSTIISSEGNIVDSSGKYTKENVDKYIAEIEEKSKCELPVPKKKSGSDIDYDKVEHFIPRISAPDATLNEPQAIKNRVFSNIRHLEVHFEDGNSTRTHGLGLFSDCMIMNEHAFRGRKDVIIRVSMTEYASGIRTIRVMPNDFVSIGNDLILVRVIGGMFRDIREYLCDSPYFNVAIKGFFSDMPVEIRQMTDNLSIDNGDYIVNTPFYYEYKNHTVGICGKPLVGTINNRTFLLGIHTGGQKDGVYGYSAVVSKVEILNGIKKLMTIFEVSSEGCLRLPKGSKLDIITKRSPILYEECPSLHQVGSITDYRIVCPKSELIMSPIFQDIEYLIGISPLGSNGLPKYYPPLMRSKIVDGKYVAPYNNWIKKVGVEKKPLDVFICKQVANDLCKYLSKSISSKGINVITPYSLRIAQNGYPYNFYIRAMKNNTSAGILFPGKKSNYNSDIEFDFKKDSKEPNFDVKEQVLEILDAYSKGVAAHSLVGAQLKDEPREYEKCVAGKTRVFAMSSYDITLVNRMYLMPFYSLMCEYRDIFYTKVGINMHSSEAGNMYNSLVEFSPFIMEGDYGGYDTSMPVEIGIIANDIVYNFLKNFGYNEYSLQVVKGILSDNLNPTLCMEGNIFVAPGFQPSGKYATAEDNSLRGLILLYYAFVTMCTSVGDRHPLNLTKIFSPEDFFVKILPVTYGDDMLCAVKEDVADYFNNITYSKFVSIVYGMEFTTASKSQHNSKFSDYTKITFLKRNFKYSKRFNRFIARLDLEAIVKSLSYILPSKEVSIDTQIVETCVSSLRELFMYCITDIESHCYSTYRNKMIKVLVKKTCFHREDLEKYFPTWEKMLDEFSHLG